MGLSSANTPSTTASSDAHGPGQRSSSVLARDALRRVPRTTPSIVGHLAELDGQVFDRRRQRAHAVAHGRQRVVAFEIEAPQARACAACASSTRSCEPAIVMHVARDDDARARHRHAVDADAAFGRGIEQPAAGHRAQGGQRRCIGGCRGIVMVRAHRHPSPDRSPRARRNATRPARCAARSSRRMRARVPSGIRRGFG